jgi:hypothetical protein
LNGGQKPSIPDLFATTVPQGGSGCHAYRHHRIRLTSFIQIYRI